MMAKAYLLLVQRAERDLKIIRDQREHYNQIIASIGSNMKKVVVQTSGNTSKTEIAAVGLVDLAEQLEKKEKEYVEIIQKAEKLIDQIKQDKFREILKRRYLIGESWKTIRDKMDYKDEKSVYRCHGYALRELQKLL